MEAAKRDVERAVESVGDGEFKDAANDLGKAATHTGHAITGHHETVGEKIGSQIDAASDHIKSAEHKIQGEYYDAKAKLEE